jgi:hypothetical protein
MFSWLTNASPVEWILLLGGIAHTLIKVGEWKRARERPDSYKGLTKTDLQDILREERHASREVMQAELLKCVSTDRYNAEARVVDQRINRLEGRVFNGGRHNHGA